MEIVKKDMTDIEKYYKLCKLEEVTDTISQPRNCNHSDADTGAEELFDITHSLTVHLHSAFKR